jgi:hypothetical protein
MLFKVENFTVPMLLFINRYQYTRYDSEKVRLSMHGQLLPVVQ